MIKNTFLSSLRATLWSPQPKGARSVGASRDCTARILKVLSDYKSTKFKRVFILEKITKFDLEVQNGLSPAHISKAFPLAYNTHLNHKRIMESLVRQLRDDYKVETEVVKAQTKGLLPFEGSNSALRPRPDLVISAGGDGTFLEASSLIPADQLTDTPIWIAGINTDPERSLGTLCMSYFGPKVEQHFKSGYYDFEKCEPPADADGRQPDLFDRSLSDFCSYNYNLEAERKIVLSQPKPAEGLAPAAAETPEGATVLTHDEYVRTLLDNLFAFRLRPVPRQRLRLKLFRRRCERPGPVVSDSTDADEPELAMDNTAIERMLLSSANPEFAESEISEHIAEDAATYRLPHGVLNDVMIADKDFGKSFYAIVQVDDRPLKRIKSSGVLVSTGSGSTAWAYNVSKMSFSEGASLVKCLFEHPKLAALPKSALTDEVVRETIECFNQKMRMDPSRAVMRVHIREGISDRCARLTRRTTDDTSFYHCTQVKVLPLSKNAVVCADGSRYIKLDYGDVVVVKTFPSDLIWSFT